MIFDALTPAPLLLVYKAEGCPACAEAETALRRLQAEHALDIIVVRLDVFRRDWKAKYGWQPNGTPAYALVVNDRIRQKHVGVMDYPELVEWLGLESR